ncbi:hypothetical protein HaLaN_14732, partial [Haematococcus lacustris]
MQSVDRAQQSIKGQSHAVSRTTPHHDRVWTQLLKELHAGMKDMKRDENAWLPWDFKAETLHTSIFNICQPNATL